MGRVRKMTEGKTDQQPRLPVKTAVTLSWEASRKLKSAALYEGRTQSDIVEGLVLLHLGGYFPGKREIRESGQEETPA